MSIYKQRRSWSSHRGILPLASSERHSSEGLAFAKKKILVPFYCSTGPIQGIVQSFSLTGVWSTFLQVQDFCPCLKNFHAPILFSTVTVISIRWHTIDHESHRGIGSQGLDVSRNGKMVRVLCNRASAVELW